MNRRGFFAALAALPAAALVVRRTGALSASEMEWIEFQPITQPLPFGVRDETADDTAVDYWIAGERLKQYILNLP